ncbi:helix-turn-helix transcriptional regulator [Methylocystis parvus]|uniref:Helix-turn-helix transcriptional regulator n=1 Tax=Methylocystis parvus TaxID=134 RepID=A0A6B8MB90_9HYPH|nr:helix-turn-helix transcriptional regulator [Methylocystis parvus]QGM98869.1 helix-turn-helix transcriptional regulator [Methylocystis parvus]WBK00778.1 helix-turn-helix transcriptional regulator [Methylocystis parvus OBBP]
MDQNLLDQIYASSFAPELWPGVMDQLSTLTEARGGVLFAANPTRLGWKSSECVAEHMDAYATQGWIERGHERRARQLALHHAGFVVESDIFTTEELEHDPTFSEFLRPRGLGWTVSTAMPLPTGDDLFICINRAFDRGPVERTFVERLDALRPHLARGAFMAARMQLERARVASETLALIGLPALVLGAGGKILAANNLIQSMTTHVRWRAHNRFSLRDETADRLLGDAIATLHDDRSAAPRSFPARDPEGEAPMIAHIIPIRGAARDIFIGCAGVLAMTPVGAPQAPSAELVQSLFDLTPAEARVARRLVVGKSIEDIATEGAVSRNTVRTHLRGVMEKTGCGRQAEVVALLGGLAPLGAASQEKFGTSSI